MSKLAEVAERLAETRRWLDQEANRLAARLDQLERRAPKAIQTAHRLIDEQLRGLDETERMVQQWLSATADAGAGKATPQPSHPAASPVGAAPPTPVETRKESLAAARDPARTVLDEQHEYVEKLERALKTMANELPEPPVEAASRSAGPGESASALDSRRLLDEPSGEYRRAERGLESALQTLANMPRPRLMPFGSATSTATEPEAQNAEDTSQQSRKLGVVRVA
ncbi:MAG: hypothetical protein K2Y71_16180 [Xanthobacteraceae bacterium]|nr:hypothetical protein [Xanthobacteraceae bacterium]